MSRPPRAISDYMAKIGKKGGSKKGPTKARDPEKAKMAAGARWAKVKNP